MLDLSASVSPILIPVFFQTLSGGGDEEDRTPDPLRARQVLSQLSYTPVFSGFKDCRFFPFEVPFMDLQN